MIIDVITIFPSMFDSITGYGVLRQAFLSDNCILNVYDLRDFTRDRHRKVDDRPYGGGPGMVLMAEPLDRAVRHIKKKSPVNDRGLRKTVLMTPGGSVLRQENLRTMAGLENLIIICGRYEGVDQRFIDLDVDMEVSIGDYVLTGGEIPAMVLIDGLVRLLPGVVGKPESLESESFEDGLLDWPHYTRPPSYRGMKVPRVLLGGNHAEIKRWRKKISEEKTRKRRPDLFDKRN